MLAGACVGVGKLHGLDVRLIDHRCLDDAVGQRIGHSVLEDHVAVRRLAVGTVRCRRGIHAQCDFLPHPSEGLVVFRGGRIVRLVIKQCELWPVHQRRQVALSASVALVELMDVAQHNAGAEQAGPAALSAAAKGGEREVVGSAVRPVRQQVAVPEHLAAPEVVLQPVAHDQVGAENHELLQITGDAQPRADGCDHGCLASPGDDVQQQPVRAHLRPAQNLVSVDHPQKRLPLMRPQRARARRPIVVIRSQELNIPIGLGLQSRQPVAPPLEKGVLVSRELIVHGSGHLDLGTAQTLAAHVILYLAGDVVSPGCRKPVLRLQRWLLLAAPYEGISWGAAEPPVVVEVPLHVDDLRPGVQNDGLADVELDGERRDTNESDLHPRRLYEGEEVFVVCVRGRERRHVLPKARRVDTDHIQPDEVQIGVFPTAQPLRRLGGVGPESPGQHEAVAQVVLLITRRLANGVGNRLHVCSSYRVVLSWGTDPYRNRALVTMDAFVLLFVLRAETPEHEGAELIAWRVGQSLRLIHAPVLHREVGH